MNKNKRFPAIVFCDGAFNTPEGKTAHGLVRFTERYQVFGIIDARYAGQDAGEVLDQKTKGIPVYADLASGLAAAKAQGVELTHFVVGLAPDGGRLPASAKAVVQQALENNLNVDSGLHDFLTNDANLMKIAAERGLKIHDVRKTPDRDQLHFFTGEIEGVDCLKIAVLGTDSAIGKRTTAWLIVHAMRDRGMTAEMIGTGQTAWMQGARYSMIMDSCINDFVSGEIEHAVVSAWNEQHPDLVVIEGQGSLMNPAYPGGFEILAAGRPDFVVLQHAPSRKEYDGFPGYELHDIQKQIEAIRVISGKEVIAITVNHEGLSDEEIQPACEELTRQTGLPAWDVLKFGAEGLVELVAEKIRERQHG